MYTEAETEYDWDGTEMVAILDPDGVQVCLVEALNVEALLSHLNRFS